jgi:hypothetical protein
MKTFHGGREAKEFLISEIVAEAQRENAPLSEVERKMLYFTESGWTLPDIMKVNEDFDCEYDQDEYEHKIAKLVVNADRRIRESSREGYDRWWAAIRFLQREDHYISVMTGLAGLRPRRSIEAIRDCTRDCRLPPRVDFLQYQVQHPHALSWQPRNFRVGRCRQSVRCLHASPIHPRH